MERKQLANKLREGNIHYLCVVDIFNEGVDIPEVDTVLFLRPTDSLTIFHGKMHVKTNSTKR